MKKALIIVDMQNDFLPGGALAVKGADKLFDTINELSQDPEYSAVIATMDWHPQGHKSFASNNQADVGSLGLLGGQLQVMWPEHCVQDSYGAQLAKGLYKGKISLVVKKGQNPNIDSYSAFFDNDHHSSTGLNEWLQAHGITHLEIVGLALDYCVKATALDAARLGYHTAVIENATKAVNLQEGDKERAIREMRQAGVTVEKVLTLW